MNKGAFNLLIDLVAAVSLTALVATGYILWFVLPPGTNRTHELVGWLRHEWGSIHFWLALVLLAALAVHVGLHWRWLSTGLCRRLGMARLVERSPRLAGPVALVIAGVPLAAAAIVSHLLARPLSEPVHAIVPENAGQQVRAMSTSTAEARVAQLLVARCSACHGADAPAEGVRADTPTWLVIPQHGVQWVTPGDARASSLLRVLHAESEPAHGSRRHALSDDELALLREWIDSLGP